ncbi:MAG: molybdopterin molybdotransferase MoeA [Myxococcales bacterium]|nr:molybdopterin molybdotransferase MoeA [Myxococcales bacterium]
MLSVEEAVARILSAATPLEAERCGLLDAVGRVLATDVVAGRALPPWDNSAMDGYALRAADLPEGVGALPVSDAIPAGDPGDRPLAAGTAARIFTGAPLPPGADTVVMQEDTAREGDTVRVLEAPRPGQHVRRRGSDVEPGAVVLRAGRILAPPDLSLLASLGRSQVAVVRAPTVAVLTSGDELLDVDAGEPGPGRIVDGNSIGLAAAVRALGCAPRIFPIVPDDRDATFEALRRAARADVLLSTGGVSVGDYDFVGDALRTLSGDRFGFWKVAIKPGKPLAFGRIGECLAFGLPGNPGSALVTFEIFVRPALLRLMGHTAVHRAPRAAVLDAPLKAGGARREYLRATTRWVDGALHVDPRRTQSSGALSSLGGADALVVVAPGAPAAPAGATATVLLLGEDRVDDVVV